MCPYCKNYWNSKETKNTYNGCQLGLYPPNKYNNYVENCLHFKSKEGKVMNNNEFNSFTWDDFKNTSYETLSDTLSLVMKDVPDIKTIKTWSRFMVGTAMHWAVATHLYASDNYDVVVPDKPDFL